MTDGHRTSTIARPSGGRASRPTSSRGVPRLTLYDGSGDLSRGIGRDVLHRLCRSARADGATSVHLEVATDNGRALHLYTSLGFTPVTTEDYYALPN